MRYLGKNLSERSRESDTIFELIFEIPGGMKFYNRIGTTFPLSPAEIDMLKRHGAIEPDGPRYLK